MSRRTIRLLCITTEPHQLHVIIPVMSPGGIRHRIGDLDRETKDEAQRRRASELRGFRVRLATI